MASGPPEIPPSAGVEPAPVEARLGADEIVFRRIPASMQWVRADGAIDLAAFLPNRGDTTTGVSLSRVATAAEAAATGRRGKKFFATRLRVGDMERRAGLVVISDSPTHAYIQGWVYSRRDEDDVRAGAEYLSSICGRAEGPFDGQLDP